MDGYKSHGDCRMSREEFEISRLKARCERLEKLAAFLACTIKAGEKWTEQCQREFSAALADDKETTNGHE